MTEIPVECAKELEEIVSKENIKYNEPMSKHTSFKTGGTADYFIIAKTAEQITEIIRFAKEKNIPFYIIGNGSNLLVKDNGVRGIIIKIDLQGIEIKSKTQEETNSQEVLVSVKAGTKIMALAQILKEQEITGFEELSGIPGTIGGAIKMNAGAYGKEMKDIVVETVCIDVDGNTYKLKNEDQKFEYRNSIFKNEKYIILEAILKLRKGDKDKIQAKMETYLTERKQKQPVEYPSAGSIFKRGEDFVTAKLIDEAGLKGFSIGGAEISEKHTGFIINKTNATSKDILDLIEYTKKIIFEKFGVKIQEEVEIIGED